MGVFLPLGGEYKRHSKFSHWGVRLGGILFEERLRYRLPHPIRQVAGKQFVNEVDWPEDDM
jgi:hypothetical protein